MLPIWVCLSGIITWALAGSPLRFPQHSKATPEKTEIETIPAKSACIVQRHNAHASSQGAYLISLINLNKISNTCHQLVSQLEVANSILEENKSELLKGSGFDINKINFLLIKLEHKFNDVIKYVKKLYICDDDLTRTIADELTKLKKKLDQNWSRVTMTEKSTRARRLIQVRPIMTTDFPTAIAALGVGVLGGGIMGLFGSKSYDSDISKINDQLHTTDNKIQITNKRIDMIAQNVSISMQKIKLILDKMDEYRSTADKKDNLSWNIEMVIETIENTHTLLRLNEISINLLRNGIINMDLIDTLTLRKVIEEGEETFPDLEFPIDVTGRDMKNLGRIMKIKEIQNGKFVAILPMIEKTKFEIYSLVPIPIKIEKHIMIANIDKIILMKGDEYIITTPDHLTKVGNKTYILDSVHPVWKTDRKSCELSAVRNNTEDILNLCNFVKVGIEDGLYLTETETKRMIYVTEKKTIIINCPEGNWRNTMIGLHLIPKNCDIESETVK